MPRVAIVLRQARKALESLDLVKVLQSEIRHELSFNRFQSNESGSLGDFVVEHDSTDFQDVVVRRKCESGEEVAVSALLGSINFVRDRVFPREVLMKVCVKKPGLSSLLQFDCEVSENGPHGSDFEIHNAYYLQSTTRLDHSVYRRPSFRCLDPQLQDALKEYLVAKGIRKSLTTFLLVHLHKKEQAQYLNWLQKLESSTGWSGK